MSIITVERRILEKNDETARGNRELFAGFGIHVLNLLSSPGSGKTSLLERTIERLRGRLSIAVIEGDLQTTLDAERVEKYGIPVVQVVTNGACHLEASLIRDAAARLDLQSVELLFIENVGNLVCPANYDLGESQKVVLLSTTEGDDKPLKYAETFRRAGVLVINKIDLLPHLPMSLEALKANALRVNPGLTIREVSCTSGAGIPEWCEWLAGLLPLSRSSEAVRRSSYPGSSCLR